MLIAWRKLKYRFRPVRCVRRCRTLRRHTGARHRGRRVAAIMLAASVVFLAAWGLMRAESRLGPVIDEIAISKLNGMVTTVSNEAVQKLMEEKELTYDMLVNRQTNADGMVTSLTMDYAEVNQLKSALALSIQEEINTMERVNISVPIGAVFSDTLMAGFGIGIPIRTLAAESIEVSFQDTFEDAGINQTRHHIEIVVKAPVSIVTPIHKTTAEITTQIPVAETVIVGSVPGTYFNLGQ